MNPYERTAEEMRRQSEAPKRFAKTALHAGATIGATSFAPMLARAAPFLSPYLSEATAVKGLSKLSPRFGNFINKAMGAGKTFDEIRDFIGEQVEESKPSSDLSEHPVERLAPELHQYLKNQIRMGHTPLQALSVAQFKHKSDIDKVSKEIKKNLFSVIDQLYGSQSTQAGQNMGMKSQQPNQTQGIDPALAQILQQGNALLQRFKSPNG